MNYSVNLLTWNIIFVGEPVYLFFVIIHANKNHEF